MRQQFISVCKYSHRFLPACFLIFLCVLVSWILVTPRPVIAQDHPSLLTAVSPTPSGVSPTPDVQLQQLYTVAQNDITVANAFVTFAGVVLSIAAVVLAAAGLFEFLGRRQLNTRFQQISHLERQLDKHIQQVADLEQQVKKQIDNHTQQVAHLEERFEKQVEQLQLRTDYETRLFNERLAALDHQFDAKSQNFMEASYNFNMGKVAYQAGDDELAIEYFQEALKFQPTNPRILERIGRSYSNLNDMPRAISCLEEALKIDEDYIPALRSLALCYRYTDPQRAIECLKHAVKVKPDGFEAMDFLGLIYRDQGLIDEAIKSHEEAFKHQKRPETEFYLSILYAMKGDKKRAKARALSAESDLDSPEHDKRIRPVWKLLIQAAYPILDGDKERAVQFIQMTTQYITTHRIHEALKGHIVFLLEASDHSDWLPEFMQHIRLQTK
jgi:tetratricopeptide (TPR) repeat protein